ncbi:hypothetical protein [Winogradskyella sp. Asnod2-B02-A]|uniref:hypothetical protein n=1 Tax=Winogradskyella sp. Asnod2-B02-A TaxID=3160583 RepID=UPI003864C4A8
MKKITYFLFALTILLTSCEGDQGPRGFDGNDGETAPAFEVTRSFNAPNYDANVVFGFDVYPDEVVLVYILWDTLDDGTKIWRQMPQTVIFEDGNDLVYNFDFTQFDVQLFLDGSNLEILDSVWTQNQIFRIIVIPTTNYNRVDYSDIEAVMSTYGIEEFQQR